VTKAVKAALAEFVPCRTCYLPHINPCFWAMPRKARLNPLFPPESAPASLGIRLSSLNQCGLKASFRCRRKLCVDRNHCIPSPFAWLRDNYDRLVVRPFILIASFLSVAAVLNLSPV